MSRAKTLFLLDLIGVLVLMAVLMLLSSCTTVNIQTTASTAQSRAQSSVKGSAWAEVKASAEATSDSAKATAGREHSVADSLGGAAIGMAGGLLAGGGL